MKLSEQGKRNSQEQTEMKDNKQSSLRCEMREEKKNFVIWGFNNKTTMNNGSFVETNRNQAHWGSKRASTFCISIATTVTGINRHGEKKSVISVQTVNSEESVRSGWINVFLRDEQRVIHWRNRKKTVIKRDMKERKKALLLRWTFRA